MLSPILADLTKDFEAWRLCIAPEKVKTMPPLQYLGQIIKGHLIHPQKVEIRKDDLRTLNDLQKLLGDINWFRPSLKLTTDTLSPLFRCSRVTLILPHFENLWRTPYSHWLR
jgi:hypothetical protein